MMKSHGVIVVCEGRCPINVFMHRNVKVKHVICHISSVVRIHKNWFRFPVVNPKTGVYHKPLPNKCKVKLTLTFCNLSV